MNTELILRVKTSIFLAIGFILLVMLSSDTVFKIAIAVMVLIAACEWANFAKLKNGFKYVFVVWVAAGLLLLYSLGNEVANYIMWLSILFWLVALFSLPFFPDKTNWIFQRPAITVLIGWVVLLSVWASIIGLSEMNTNSRTLLLLFVMWVAFADVGAYFSGKKFGKNKLIPKVSPGKTWQGFFGGLLLVLLSGCLVITVSNDFQWNMLFGLLLLSVFSVVGDLTISCYKRTNNLKDSGSILPGHGGVLDRIDGVLAAAPVYYVFVAFL